MSLNPTLAYYQPWRLRREDFLVGFIARTDLADHLLERLRQTVIDGDPRHRLILGPRGMGKTSLLRRLAIGIADDPGLAAALLPLTFREEQYNVRSLDQLWRNCGEALAEWHEASDDAAAADALDRAIAGPDWHDAERAGEAFCAAVAATGRRAVLLVDNLDLILDAMPPDQHWQWRKRLQAAGGPMLVGAATQAPRQLGDRDAAFYEFFRLDRLDPLTEVELLRCLRRLAELHGEAGLPVLALLNTDVARLKVIHRLSGGNPRILTLLYQVLARAENDTVFADLEALLDQVTPLYKARVEDLRSDLQRAMLDAVALHFDPITANALARITGEPVTTVSSQLSRLREAGYIEEVRTSGSRAGYQLVERFFNIWYLMRHGTRRTRQRMRWLTAFLRDFFSAEELRGMQARFRPAATSRWHPLYAEALSHAIAPTERMPRRRAGTAQADYVTLRETARAALAAGDATKAEGTWRAAIARDARDARPWNALGTVLANLPGRAAEAEQAYREAIARDAAFALPWNNLGHLLSNQPGRAAEAEQAYREAIARDAAFASPWFQLGMLLADQPGRAGEAEQAYREAIARDAAFAWPWNNLGHLLSNQPGRAAEAEQAYREAIARDAALALPWNNLGDLLADQPGRAAEAEQAYREAIARDAAFAWSWFDLGDLLADQPGRAAEAEQAYREAIARDGTFASPWFQLGMLLADQPGRAGEAEQAYREAIARDANLASPWNNLGALFAGQPDRAAEAEQAYREAIARDAAFAWPWNNLGDLLANQPGRAAEAEQAYREAIARDAAVAWTWNNIGHLLSNQPGRAAEAEQAYREAIARDAAFAWPWNNLGDLLARQPGRAAEAEQAYREAIARDGTFASPWFQLGMLLSNQPGRAAEAEQAYREAIARDATNTVAPRYNIIWMQLLAESVPDAADVDLLGIEVPALFRHLLDAGVALVRDNLGDAWAAFGKALAEPSEGHYTHGIPPATLWLLRLSHQRGHGEWLIARFQESGAADRQAPLHAAFVALVRGVATLRDISPETRGVAETLFARLHLAEPAPPPAPVRPRRGRPRRTA
jgi:Flp pilus assembly protein TadD/DNA-binding transcriptional ArsR family regulator